MPNFYCAPNTLKGAVGINDNDDDPFIDLALGAVSRRIDSHCGRKFWLDSTATARTFVPRDSLNVELIDPYDGTAADIGTLSGLIVKSDTGNDGTYATTLTVNTDFRVLPTNAATMIPEARPWRELQMVGSKVFMPRPLYRFADSVQVTAKWGWPAVPAAVQEACLIQAARLYKRRFSPEGVAGFGEFGVVRVTRVDPDVADLLADYRFDPAMVG